MPVAPLSGFGPALPPPSVLDLHPVTAAVVRSGDAFTNLLAQSEVPRVGSAGTDSDPAAVREAARQLESYFLTLLLQQMREPRLTPEDAEGPFVQSREERMFLQQLDQALGDELSRTGQLGLADLIVRQLLPADSDAQTSRET